MNHDHTYLLEIGTEELPVGFAQALPEQLTRAVRATFEAAGLPWSDEHLSLWVTPRRIALQLRNLPDQQPDREQVVKGPPCRVGLDAQGQPTPAGLGFARKQGIAFDQLTQETLDGEAYLVLRQTLPGQPLRTLMAEAAPQWILNGLSGAHFMRWGDGDDRFSRPIRWVVSLWDDELLPCRIAEVPAGRLSWGHRVLSPLPVELRHARDYATQMQQEGHVLVDPAARQATIRQQLEAAAQAQGGYVPIDPDLLNTVTYLVEAPNVVVGDLDPAFLSLPAMVIRTVLSAHQKTFAVMDPNPSVMLKPVFLAVSNGRPEAADIIRAGNARVIQARLADATFFFQDDQKQPLGSRLESLAGITFQKGLGSLADKTRRLMALCGQTARFLPDTAVDVPACVRAAELSKCDLATGMVRELTELQGTMGQEYARRQGEADDVADALFEQYLPRFEGDALPETLTGLMLSLADKADTMVAVFAQPDAKPPTGSRDPLGLRRMANGMLLSTLAHAERPINLSALLETAYQVLAEAGLARRPVGETLPPLREFILQRLRGHLLDQQFRHDVIDAVLSAGDPLADLAGVRQRLRILTDWMAERPEDFSRVYAGANRVARILGDAFSVETPIGPVDASLLSLPSERQLADALDAVLADYPLDQPVADRAAYLSRLGALAPAVEAFFEVVMVNDPDARLRENRQNLLHRLNRLALRIAAFHKLAV